MYAKGNDPIEKEKKEKEKEKKKKKSMDGFKNWDSKLKERQGTSEREAAEEQGKCKGLLKNQM